MTKVRQTFEISLTKSIVRVLFMRFELPLTPNPPPPPHNILMAPVINMSLK